MACYTIQCDTVAVYDRCLLSQPVTGCHKLSQAATEYFNRLMSQRVNHYFMNKLTLRGLLQIPVRHINKCHKETSPSIYRLVEINTLLQAVILTVILIDFAIYFLNSSQTCQ